MGTTQEEPTLKELVSRLAALEQAHARLQEKLGAGAMLELSSEAAPAAKPPRPGVFASDVAGTPAVSASGTNGADGVDATSDSGTGVSATSGSGTGLLATSSSGLAGHFVGNVTMDNNLNVAGALSTGTLNSGAGTFASGVSNTPAVKASGTNGADGMDASSDSGTGLVASSSSGDGIHGGTGSGIGVRGDSSSGVGVIGTSQTGDGIHGFGSIGVVGQSDTGVGIQGLSDSGLGVRGDSNSSSGIYGNSNSGNGVTGFSNSGSGVAGNSSSGSGVAGNSSSGSGVSATSSSGLAGNFVGDVAVTGNFSASGTKNFVQAHPTDPSREIVYVALEGGEAGTYVRGTGQLVNGKAVLELPEHFRLVTDTQGLTIHLTARGAWLQLYVVELDTAQIVVREAQGQSGTFDYLIHGVRRGYEQHEVIRTKR